VKTILHVNQRVIANNRKTGRNDPPLIVRTYKGSTPASQVEILGPSRIVHSPHKPLSCGARVWIETTSQVNFL